MPVALAFMTMTALRFLPLLLGEIAIARQARRLRGYRFHLWTRCSRRAALARGLALELAILLPVMAASLRRATALATSVASRGFDPDAPRTCYPPLQFTAGERVFLFVLAAGWSGVLLAKLAYWIYASGLFYVPALRPVYDVARNWL